MLLMTFGFSPKASGLYLSQFENINPMWNVLFFIKREDTYVSIINKQLGEFKKNYICANIICRVLLLTASHTLKQYTLYVLYTSAR